MSIKKPYSRYFIIFDEDDRGFGISLDKLPTGYLKIETKNGECKITVYVQNLKRELGPYTCCMIDSTKNPPIVAKLGEVPVDEFGIGEMWWEFKENSIADTSLSVDKFNAAAVATSGEKFSVPLSGYAGRDKTEWKNRIVTVNRESKAVPELVVKEEIDPAAKKFKEYEESINVNAGAKKIEDRIEEDIEKTAKVNAGTEKIEDRIEEDIEKTAEVNARAEKIEDRIEEDIEKTAEVNAGAEKIEDRLEEDIEKTVEVNDDFNNAEVNTDEYAQNGQEHMRNEEDEYEEKTEEINIETTDEEIISKDLRENLNEEDILEDISRESIREDESIIENKDTDNERNAEYNFIDEYAPKIIENIPFVDDDEDIMGAERGLEEDILQDINESIGDRNKNKKRTHAAMFHSVLKNFEEVKELRDMKKGVRWWKIPFDYDVDMDDNKLYPYFCAIYHLKMTYPYINYIKYFKKCGHYYFGLKYNSDGEVKHLMYGIEGGNNMNEQPYMGMTGFVKWMKFKDKGMWIMFYNPYTGCIMIPKKREKER